MRTKWITVVSICLLTFLALIMSMLSALGHGRGGRDGRLEEGAMRGGLVGCSCETCMKFHGWAAKRCSALVGLFLVSVYFGSQ